MRFHGFIRQNRVTFIGIGTACLILGAFVYAPGREYLSFAVAPTVARAYELGSMHFDAQNPKHYDLDRAEYFFTEALERDPAYPYLNHQLARIAFLKGNFALALMFIDREIMLYGAEHANAYYVRGLIKGFVGDYDGAARDYEEYLVIDPTNWAAINDYAWVLLKDRRYEEALIALDGGLLFWPENPWLHNSRATALFELGRFDEALEAASAASSAVASITEAEWLRAYPGNDPLIASQGIAAFRRAIAENMHTIEHAVEAAAKDVP